MSRKTRTPVRVAPRPLDDGRHRRRFRLWLAAAVVLAFGAGVPAGMAIAGPGTSGEDAAVAEMREQEARRDAAQITELTTMARATQEALGPVVDGLAAAAPEGGAGAPEVPQARLSEWRTVMTGEVKKYEETVSGATGTNLARNALRSSVNMLSVALDTYVMAADLPEDRRASALGIVTRQRSLAVATWSVAATQLDQLNIDAGNGHQHVDLTGAPMNDGFPEGHTE
ncbi:hypothetical protein Misp01_68780 [Microtetraspora sp. NBRC 13810]|uniref:hypothetical protein n=1 Tax=Microtetraspora sp. NBRC 13810 TaxID=3030990 RepID=UPI0024A14D1C|nr:hypothetical protein [Microtetraspora sp. NBRC 13810]GLW11750.1 hypothetical protein Misp01_68780 [Microtetraspora sp. NBRC 13810]